MSRPAHPVDLVGRTPLADLSRLSGRPRVRLYGKCEWTNPGGSVKDRPALSMIRDGEARGVLTPGKTILEATSGNTGIGLAWIGAALGYAVELCVPANLGPAKRSALLAFGARLVETDPLLGTDGAILEARRRADAEPARFFYTDQYANPANPRAHFETTAPEIWEQTGGTITHFIAGLGTSGTMMGAGARLKELASSLVRVAVEPDLVLHGLEGLKHMESAMVPAIFDPKAVECRRAVATETAYAMCRRVARETGWWIGVSSGAAVAAAVDLARTLDEATIVVVLPDGGERYAEEAFWR